MNESGSGMFQILFYCVEMNSFSTSSVMVGGWLYGYTALQRYVMEEEYFKKGIKNTNEQ